MQVANVQSNDILKPTHFLMCVHILFILYNNYNTHTHTHTHTSLPLSNSQYLKSRFPPDAFLALIWNISHRNCVRGVMYVTASHDILRNCFGRELIISLDTHALTHDTQTHTQLNVLFVTYFSRMILKDEIWAFLQFFCNIQPQKIGSIRHSYVIITFITQLRVFQKW